MRSLAILTVYDGVPGSKFDRKPEKYTAEQLKRWLKCRGLKLGGTRGELVTRVSDCIKKGNDRILDVSIDQGKWFAAKFLKENTEIRNDKSMSHIHLRIRHLQVSHIVRECFLVLARCFSEIHRRCYFES